MVNHGLAAKLATDFCLLKSSDRLFSYGRSVAYSYRGNTTVMNWLAHAPTY